MSYNDITGDKIATKTVTDQYRNNWSKIFRDRNKKDPEEEFKEFLKKNGVVSYFPGSDAKVSKSSIMENIDSCLKEIENDVCAICWESGTVIDDQDNEWVCPCGKSFK